MRLFLVLLLSTPAGLLAQQYWLSSSRIYQLEMQRLAMMPDVREYTVERTYPNADAPYREIDSNGQYHQFYEKDGYVDNMGEDRTGIVRRVLIERRNDSTVVTEGTIRSSHAEDIHPPMRYLQAYVFGGHGRKLYEMGREYRYDAAGRLTEERDLLNGGGYYRAIVHYPNAKGKDTLREEYYGSDLPKISYSRFWYDDWDSLTSVQVYAIRYPQKDYLLSNGTMKYEFSPDHRIKRMMLPKLQVDRVVSDSFFYNGSNDTFYFSRDGIYEGVQSAATRYNNKGMPTRLYAKGHGYFYDETYSYDEAGRIKEIVWYYDTIRYREVFTYDEEGKPLTQIRYSPDGKERRVLRYTYK